MSGRTTKQRRAAARRRAWCAAWRRLVDDRGELREERFWVWADYGIRWAYAGRLDRLPLLLAACSDDMRLVPGPARDRWSDTRSIVDNRPSRSASRRRGVGWPFDRGNR